MIIKDADEKESDLSILEGLAGRRDVKPETRKRIEREVRNIRAGLRGEEESAYEINFHYGASKNYAIIHDLRIEHEGRVAQIDHLVINRFLEMWVCESKNFSEGIAINEQGECAAFYNSKPYGVPSPFEQNKKHIKVLRSLFSSNMVSLPRRMGLAIKPNMKSVVLVSKKARISRPKKAVADLESIIKNDQFAALIDRAIDSNNNPLTISKIIGSATLEAFARSITAQHQPITFRWAAKFGLSECAPDSPSDPVARASATPPPLPPPATQETVSPPPLPIPVGVPAQSAGSESAAPKKKKKKLICATCSEAVEFQVARFCWLNKARFGEYIYCRECQKAI